MSQHAMLPVPRCFPLDTMHLFGINVPIHLITIWRNSGEIKITFSHLKPKLDFIVLDKSKAWKTHGRLVASTRSYLLTSFGRTPRDPVKKINSGYKSCEFMIYFWVLGPAVFRLVLPHHLWQNFCKLVRAVRIVHQRTITLQQLEHANKLLLEWESEFKHKYYACDIEKLHVMRPCIHATVHVSKLYCYMLSTDRLM